MDSPRDTRQAGAPQQQIADRSNSHPPAMEGDPLSSASLSANPAVAESIEPPSRVAIWMRRFELVVFVAVCIWLGLALLFLPWTPVWSDNHLLVRFPWLRSFAMNSFLRGMISGLGLIDIFIGVWEGVTYSEKKPA